MSTTEADLYDAVIRDGTADLSAVAVWLTFSPAEWCVIGGMAADSWAPPAIYAARVDVAADQEPAEAIRDLAEEGFQVRLDTRAQVAEVIRPGGGHRLQVRIHYSEPFRSMPAQASRRVILGQVLPVAALADTVAGLLAVCVDATSRPHDRRKAELDLFRLAEAHPAQVDDLLPPELRQEAQDDREHAHALAHAQGDGWANLLPPRCNPSARAILRPARGRENLPALAVRTEP